MLVTSGDCTPKFVFPLDAITLLPGFGEYTCCSLGHMRGGKRVDCDKVKVRHVMDRLRAMQSREQASLQEQEKDLLRAFRARLWDVQFELESERSKKDDGALEWIEKTKTLGKELDWSREEALRLDRMNQFLTKENCRKYWMGELQMEISESESF